VVTDAAHTYPAVLDELIPPAWHHVEQQPNNPIEADHSQLEHRLRPMRGLPHRRDRSHHHRRPRVHALALRAVCGIETRVWLCDVAGLAPAEVGALQ
jgi:DDE domain